MGILIIAEAGVNHNGDINCAKRLIDCAAEAGADLVKFQTYDTDEIVIPQAEKAGYQVNFANAQESQRAMLKQFELSKEMHYELVEYCENSGIGFFSTGFDLNSLDLLLELGQTLFKVPSGELNNLPYLRRIGEIAEEVILSTGMSTLADIECALDILVSSGSSKDKITILHCTSEYPAPMDGVNLRLMSNLKSVFGTNVGYSDHTVGIEIPVAAVALGARVIEKHFTLDSSQVGPDHAASIEPQELADMVAAIRNVEVALGDGVKNKISTVEASNRLVVRKSLVAKREIKLGELLTAENLCVKRPGNGLSPMLWDDILNTKAVKNFEKNEQIII